MCKLGMLFVATAISVAGTGGLAGWASEAEQILSATGVQGGLVVHVGCGEGHLTAALRASDRYVVHGLDTDTAAVARARTHIRSLGLYGKVSVDTFNEKSLPYIDNSVNLVVGSRRGETPTRELLRVLCPGGVAYTKSGGEWTKTVKPWPKEIDEWTHYLHDSSGNRVAHDTVVGPPRRLQWTGAPRWARSHEHTASLNAMVSAGGRVFYIMDEGPKNSIQLPPKWYLTARDAFNGTILWKRPIARWYNHLFPLKSGPARHPRRLVAVGNRVYVTLGVNAPFSQLDAATGEMIQTYAGTKTTQELVVLDGVLHMVVKPDRLAVTYEQEDANCWKERDRASRRWGWDQQPQPLVAIDAQSGQTLWSRQGLVVPLSLAATKDGVFFHDGQCVVRLDRKTGKQLWRSQPVDRSKLIPTGYSPSMIVYDDVVLFSGKKRSLVVLSVKDGKQLWTSKLNPSGHFCPEDVFVMDGLVWSGDIASSYPRSSGVYCGRDPHTGQIKSEFPPDIDPLAVMHQRCYPGKATDRYLMPSWIGIEFIDPKTKEWQIHHWVRGGCVYGIMPCNGLVYATPNACACYYQSKLTGFNALAPARESSVQRLESRAGKRVERGPAFADAFDSGPSTLDSSDWPMYRHDAARSGRTAFAVSRNLKPAWQTRLGATRISPPVVADGKLLVAAIDQQTVHALDADSGERLWSFTAGGRVDSPPTVWRGRALFGSADGWVYCLRLSDGALAWRFRVAPIDQRLMSYGQLESVWPVRGSVLIQNDRSSDSGRGVAYCLAGRSMFLDGGMRLVRLDPATGEKLSETILDDRDPETGQNLQQRIQKKKMPVALPDILSSDGQFIYMRSQRFTLQGRRAVIDPEPQDDQQGSGVHLFCPTGLLDDSWFHRSYWIYGRNAGEGWAEWSVPARLVPSGRILALGDTCVYGYGRHPKYLCNSSVLEYRLFAADMKLDPARVVRVQRAKIPENVVNWKNRAKHPEEDLSAVHYQWVIEKPGVIAKALVLADRTLLVAGPPDVVDEEQIWGRTLEPKVQSQLASQSRALAGSQGALLWAVSADDGKKLFQRRLDAVPVFDGMIAAGGRLYLAMQDGCVMCLGGD